MARVSSILSAGLASARDFTAEPTQAEETRQAVTTRADRRERLDSAGLPPDWLTTGAAGLGAGFLFGPVGALVVGGVAGILSKRRRAALAEYATQSAEATTGALEEAEAALGSALELAETDTERAEIKLRQSEFKQAAALAGHPDPSVRAQGLLRALDAAGQLDAKVDDWQAEREEVAAREREQFGQEITRFNSIRDDLVKESGNYLIRRDAYKRMLQVEDSAWGDQVLLVNAFKVIDPNSAVLPGEAATAANAAGVPDFMLTAYNRIFRGGERLSPTQRADLIRQTGLQFIESREAQIVRNTEAMERARDQRIRPELLDTLAVPIDRPDILPLPRKPREGRPGEVEGRGELPAEGDPIAFEQPSVGLLARTRAMFSPNVRNRGVLPDRVQSVVDKLPRGARVFVDRDSGDLVISEKGKPSRAMGLGQATRNSILATVPGEDELEQLPESEVDVLLRNSPTHRIERPVND